MESLLTKGIGDIRRQEFPAGRNRYAGMFSPVPEGEFAPLGEQIQPIFQEAGFAPKILVRDAGGGPVYHEVKITYGGEINSLALGQTLYDPHSQQIVDQMMLERFEGICEKVAETITNFMSPKGWFGKRRSSSAIMAKPCFVKYNMQREQALAIGKAFADFMANLPRYERTVRVDIGGVDADAEEIEEFLDFAGFPEQERPGIWYERELSVLATLKDGSLILAIPCVPRTVAPDIIYNNLLEVARRFTLEFGGVIKNDNERAAQVMVGWRNVLARVNLVPGDDESRELFIDPIPSQ